MMTDEKLKELRVLASVATPGPWEYRFNDGSHNDDVVSTGKRHTTGWPVTVAEGVASHDVTFIAAAHPGAVIAMIDEIDRLKLLLAVKGGS